MAVLFELDDNLPLESQSAGFHRYPVILSHVSGAAEVFSLGLDASLLGFQGHFPGNPILPGVVQVDWAIRLGTQVFGPLGPFQGLTHLKFIDIIRPEEPLELHLTLEADRQKLHFQYTGQSGRKASGIVVFGVAAPLSTPYDGV